MTRVAAGFIIGAATATIAAAYWRTLIVWAFSRGDTR